jgi:hypothetical protein
VRPHKVKTSTLRRTASKLGWRVRYAGSLSEVPAATERVFVWCGPRRAHVLALLGLSFKAPDCEPCPKSLSLKPQLLWELAEPGRVGVLRVDGGNMSWRPEDLQYFILEYEGQEYGGGIADWTQSPSKYSRRVFLRPHL